MTITALDPTIENASSIQSRIHEAVGAANPALEWPDLASFSAALAIDSSPVSLLKSAGIGTDLISKLVGLVDSSRIGIGLDLGAISSAAALATDPYLASSFKLPGIGTDLISKLVGLEDIPTLGFSSVISDMSGALFGKLFELPETSMLGSALSGTGLGSFKAVTGDPLGIASMFEATAVPSVAKALFSLEQAGLFGAPNPVVPSFKAFGELEGLLEYELAEPNASATSFATDTVADWLGLVRIDLRRKYEGMWQSLLVSLDPVLHASTSAVELLLHLCDTCGASDREVVAWAHANPEMASEAVDMRSGHPRVTWAGRARLIAIRAGYDLIGQELVLSLASSGSKLQQIKHRAHRFEISDIEKHLRRVDELVTMLAWRIDPT